MGPPSGFVPVPFRRVGQLLLALGCAGLLLLGIAELTSWLSMPSATLVMSLSALVIGLYLIYFVPRQNND
jgi:hypothetical protein